MTRRPSGIRALALVAALIICLSLTAGCGQEQKRQTINESSSLFHIKIPADWSSQAQQGLIAIYAAEEAPTSEELDNLSMGIFTTRDTTDSPVPEALSYVVEKRSQDRGWTAADISEPKITQIGGREGAMLEVAGTDAQGVEFRANYYFVRTSGAEVLVIAASPAGQWDDHRQDVETIVADEWYWHLPADTESTTTAQ
ncbi:MAG: hypothetical protein CVT60_06205 [Actinobacteria bacterium HGW-Actinobacteria-10]|nr:MAG: hypothetical protein CVT60_06205 [Actinobacteria bacterium HGW-Actinobacteria-10]